jgi:hypothetical protein
MSLRPSLPTYRVSAKSAGDEEVPTFLLSYDQRILPVRSSRAR